MRLTPHTSGSYSHDNDPGEPSTGSPRLSVTDMEGAILSALFNGMTVLEFGTGLGVSSTHLSATAQRVYTVDIDPWVHDVIWPTLPANVVTVKDRDNRTIRIVDGVFIDGDHSFDATVTDVADALERAMLLVVVHDFNADMVRDASESVTDGWLHIPTTHGLGVKWLT